jgi:hypothetical protein
VRKIKPHKLGPKRRKETPDTVRALVAAALDALWSKEVTRAEAEAAKRPNLTEAGVQRLVLARPQWSQAELARDLGLSPPRLADYIAGRRPCPPKVLAALGKRAGYGRERQARIVKAITLAWMMDRADRAGDTAIERAGLPALPKPIDYAANRADQLRRLHEAQRRKREGLSDDHRGHTENPPED